MGGGQSQDSPTATARNSPDQRNRRGGQVSGGDVSSRKSAVAGVPSLQSQADSSRRTFHSVEDGRRGGGMRTAPHMDDSGESPSSRHHSLTQSHNHHHHHPLSSHPHPHQRPHHRQRHRPQEPLPLDLELSMPLFASRTQPLPNEPSSESLHPDLELVLPRPSTSSSRHRRYYDGGRSEDLDLDLSMAALSRRLRAVGLMPDDSGSSDGGSSSRRHHRPRRHHSHSASHGGRSRHHLSGSAPPSSVVLVRGLSARMTCPLCSKEFTPQDLEEHLLTCMTKPRVRYNVDTLNQDSGECSICLEDMLSGEQIARLPCLCIYHIKCLKQWYRVNPTCPEHPDFTA